MTHPFSEHKKHGHHHKSHMMMPGLPFSNLVVSHAALAFSILEHSFNPIALALHPRQGFNIGCLRKIRQRYLRIRLAPKQLAYYQLPFVGLLRYAVPNIHSLTESSNLQRASTGLTQFQNRQIRKSIIADNFTDFKAFGVGSIAFKFAATLSFFLRNIGRWVLQIQMKIRMDIHNESLAHLVQCFTKSRPLTITGVGTDPSKPKVVFASVLHNLNGKLIFGFKTAMSFWNTCFSTAFGILGPLFFRQIQAHINRNRVSVIGQRAEYRYLAIVNFSQSAQPLARRTNRHPSLFFKPAFINQKTGDFLVSQKSVSFTGDVGDNGSGIPLGVGQKLLKIARFGLRNNLGHAIHVFTGASLHQTTCVLTRLVRYIVPVRSEVFAEVFHKGHKTSPDAGERRLWGCIRYPPGFRTLSPGLVSCIFL